MSGNNYKQILDYINELNGSIVEIGTSTDNGSTTFFADLVYRYHKFKFHTVDINEEPYLYASELSKNIHSMNSYKTTGESFLFETFPNLNEKICYAFLDNYDYNIHEGLEEPEWIKEQRIQYQKRGLEYSNQKSESVHLEQTKLLVKYADKKCLIQFDDTLHLHTEFKGKGAKAALFLIGNGWTIIPGPYGSVTFKNF